MMFVKAVRPILHSAAGLSRLLTGGPHGKRLGSLGLGHVCRDPPPCIQPSLFKLELKFRECWGGSSRGQGKGGKHTQASCLKGNGFIMFIDWYLGVVLVLSGHSVKILRRQVVSTRLAPLL